MSSLRTQYNILLDEGIAITDIYIYHLLVNDPRSYNYSEQELDDMVEDILNQHYNGEHTIEELVESCLNGDNLEEDDNE